MGSLSRLSSRLTSVSSLLKAYNCNCRQKHITNSRSVFYLLGISGKTPLSSTTNLKHFLPASFVHNCRTYSSFTDDSDRGNKNFYSDSDEFPVIRRPHTQRSRHNHYEDEESWDPSFRQRRQSFSGRQRYPRYSADSDFRRAGRVRNFDFEDSGDEYESENLIGRLRESRELGANIKKKEWNISTLSSIEKNFYILHQDVAERSNQEIEDYYATHNITVSRGEKPIPLSDFHEANYPEKIVKYLENNEWSNPTPIQSLGWPIALSGKNMVGLAQTGSGKTLGFILPALVHIKHQRPVDRGEGPIVLVLAPTRELAQQIKSVAVEYGRLLGIQSCSIFGGQSKMIQAKHISQGPELVVATPGRLLDFLESEVINLDRTTYVVLDEADRMLDMGFEPQIRKVLNQIRPDRQILMWSATWPREIQQLAHDYLGEFTQINIGSQELTANPNIEQVIKVCEWREKFGSLLNELEEQYAASEDKRIPKTLIFAKTKRSADILSSKLRNRRFQSDTIHGDKSQLYRDQALHRFRTGKTQILVATDVAARGLDVDDIKVVVNYDYPNSIDDYIHRIGRTARGSKTGRAVTFITDDDAGQVDDLISTLKKAGQEVDPELAEMARLSSMLRKKSSYKGSNKPNFQRRKPPRFNNNRHRSERFDSW